MAPKRKAAFDPDLDPSTQKKARTPTKNKAAALDPKQMNTVVSKTIRDNFKGWSSVAIDGTLRKGLSFRDMLVRDYQKHLADPATFPMGSSYYASIKELCKAADPTAKKFVIKNLKDTVSEGLMAAMKETQHYHKNVQPLLTQMQLMTSCNQKELIGILKFNDTRRPSVSTTQWNTAPAIASFVVRLDLQKTCKDDIALARPTSDNAFVAAFESLRRDGITIKTFVDMYRPSLEKQGTSSKAT